MDLKPDVPALKKVIFIFTLILTFHSSDGQTTPQYPVAYRVFNPFIFNPAIAGSKDYLSIDLLAGKYDESKSQMITGSARLAKSPRAYFTSPDSPEFTNIGVGGSFFNETDGLFQNMGISGAASYHVQVDKNALSFLSVGVSAKAVYNKYAGDQDLNRQAKNTFYPNFDFGVYYYSPSLFTGVSVTNLMGNPESPDSSGFNTIRASRRLFFQIGYKLVISRSLNILMEPSVIINSNDSFTGYLKDMVKPMLKIYAEDFCLGTYFNDFDKYSFFLQYKYPKFQIGTYFELPNGSPFYKKPLLIEFTLGINISAIKYGNTRINHW
jgi:type IX secretion system PorP/SprF family membrane protein